LKLKQGLLLLCLLPSLGARAAADFDTGGSAPAQDKPAHAGADNSGNAGGPQILQAGDVPTAYAMLKYEMRADIRFYEGGGVVSKVDLGIFPRFSIGGGLNVPNAIGSGNIPLDREDASLSARLLAFKEDESMPAISLGWDGPAYDRGELRGLYVALSKEFRSPMGYAQAHGGVNTSVFNSFVGSRDLRAFAALTATYQQVTAFVEGDEFINPAGPRLNSGFRVFFDPISLGLEFQDLGGLREGVRASRLLRVSYTGLF
jgi:hypothetical protein